MIRRLIPFAVLLLAAPLLPAAELSVDQRSVVMNEIVTVTLSLEGAFASLDRVDIPLQNLALVGQPWVSSEFSWTNGEVVRRKVFRYRVRALAPGPARAGPVVIDAGDGQRLTLPAVALSVAGDVASSSNDPGVVLRQLLANGRDPFFLIATADKESAVVGEQVLVTWMLYNAAVVQQWQIGSVPKLDGFWTEEIDVRRVPVTQTEVGGVTMTAIPIRRVALYPLRSGRLEIAGLTFEAALMRERRSPFSIFEGEMVQATYTSAPLTIDVSPIPAGAPVDLVGDVNLTCAARPQLNGGPVVVEATVQGRANLRATGGPRFAGRVDGLVQTQSGPATTIADDSGSAMSRRWKVLIFPAREGTLVLPPLTLSIFDPAAGARRELRCSVAPLSVSMAAAPAGDAAATTPAADTPRSLSGKVLAGIAALLLCGALIFRATRHEMRLRRETARIIGGDVPSLIDRLPLPIAAEALSLEMSDRGDAYRALRSIVETAARDPESVTSRDVRGRVREFLLTVRSEV